MTNRPFPLRKRRELSQIVDDAISVYGSSYLPRLLVLSIPTAGLNLTLLVMRLELPAWVNGTLALPITFVLGSLLGTGAVYALDQADRGNPIGPTTAITAALRRATILIGAGLRSTIIACLYFLTIVGIPRALVKFVQWSFIHESIMVDGQEGEGSLAYCSSLVSGRGWPTFGNLFVVGLIGYLVSGMPQVILRLIFDDWTAGLVGVGLMCLVFPFSITAHLLIYYDLKMRKALEMPLAFTPPARP